MKENKPLMFELLNADTENYRFVYASDILSVSAVRDKDGAPRMLVTLFDHEFQVTFTILCCGLTKKDEE